MAEESATRRHGFQFVLSLGSHFSRQPVLRPIGLDLEALAEFPGVILGRACNVQGILPSIFGAFLGDFFHRDLIFKVIRIERIDPSLRGFGLRIHEIHQGTATVSG